jgi:hypothetical protein
LVCLSDQSIPPVFIIMMEYLSQGWTIMSKSLKAGQLIGSYQVTTTDRDLTKSADFGTNVIVDDVFLYANCVQFMLLLWRCSLQVFLRHHASIKLKKCSIMPDASREGNIPAQSKSPTYEELVRPATTSDLHSIKGMFSWYYNFIDWFEVRTTAWQKILSTLTDQKDMAIPP